MVLSILAFKTLLSIVGMSLTVDALSFENFIDPLLRNGEEMKLEDQLFELGRVLDDAARNLLNLTVGSSTTLSHTNALFVIIIVSGLIFAIFSLTVMAASSIFAGLDEENENIALGQILSSETANSAARLFLSYINSTTTVSASYALVVILGISLALLALLGLAYMTASAIFTGTSVQSYYGKRSLPDSEENELNFRWARIIQILHEMEENFCRLGAEKNENDCRKRLVCRLNEKNNDSKDFNKKEFAKLTHELSDLYENNELDTERSDVNSFYESVKTYHEAVKHGRELEDCATVYPNCDRY